MDWAGWALFGLVATAALTAVMIMAQLAGLTRLDLPLLLGTIVTEDPDRARVAGFFLHLLIGQGFALGYAAAHGCTKMALHTAQPAAALIAMYQSWGYALVGTCDWRPHTNFLSVLMSKPLAATHSTNAA